MKAHNPETIAAPIGAFVHGLEVPADSRILYVSGQIGSGPDGSIPEDMTGQATVTWTNIREILRSADMDIENIVKMTAYLTDADDLAAYGAVRAAVLGDHRPTSTLLFVPTLVMPALKVEVEVVAAK